MPPRSGSRGQRVEHRYQRRGARTYLAALDIRRARDFLLPVLVLKESALDHNVELVARYCREHGVSLAPHGKTTMAPQLFKRQLGAVRGA